MRHVKIVMKGRGRKESGYYPLYRKNWIPHNISVRILHR